MPNEAHARLLINDQLQKSGWTLVDNASRKADVHVECPTGKENLDSGHAKHGFADYLLFDQHSFPLAVVEAKAEHIHPLAAKEQARAYARSQHIRFVYLANGKITFFWDLHDGNPVPRTGFHSPAELAALAAAPAAGQGTSARTRQAIDPGQGRRILPDTTVAADYLARSQIPDYDQLGQWKNESTRPAFIAQHKLCFLRPYQLAAIQAVQAALAAGKNRYLLEMATGTGKTKTCAALIKLFLKSGATHRVLFLVDRVELEDQAEKAFNQVLAKDYATVVYKRQRRDWRKAEIVVSTVQSFMANERYREEFSPADFGLIISDEAHRSINGEARKVFEYFRGYKLGLTATPRDFLRGVWAEGKKLPDEFELDRRSFLDTYIIFGCDSGLPTFRYSLLDGVRDGYLVNPTVLDCRTEKTTKLLSEEGLSFTVTDDEGNEEEANFGKRDFETRYFSDETNRAFVQTFLDHALRDPVSGEIGKSLVFCVSQSHAARITQLLNEEIELRQPKAYESAFACQVTSQVTDRQAMTVAFSQNTLGGKTKALMDYDSSRVRVCVTVGMMTTGYDCEDLLNVALMRPVFSPSEFVQMKGRGTRKHDFAWFNPKNRQTLKQAKTTFHFFDFFASYEYFEEEYDYDQVKKIPLGGGGTAGDGPEPPKPRLANDDSPDALKETRWIAIGEDGMKIDRMLWQDFSDKIYRDADIQRAAGQDDWATVLRYIQTRIFQRPDKETAAETPDDGLSALRGLLRQRDERGLSALFSRLFGRSVTFPTKDSLLDQAFERFAARHPVEGAEREDLRYFFKAYVGEQRIRDLIDTGRYGELNQTALPTERLKRLPGWRQVVADIRSDQLIEEFGEPG